MTTTASEFIQSDLGLLNKGWLEKFEFDLKDDSSKVEVNDLSPSSINIDISRDGMSSLNDIVTTPTSTTTDTYLQSILSSSGPVKKAASELCTGTSECNCYRCQRQRRRAVTFRSTAPSSLLGSNAYTPLDRLQNTTATEKDPYLPTLDNASSQVNMSEKGSVEKNQSTTIKRQHTVLQTTSELPRRVEQQKPVTKTKSMNRNSTLRKTPTIKSYEKHMPPPEYPEDDSIYRAERLRKMLEDKEATDHRQLSESVGTAVSATSNNSTDERNERHYHDLSLQRPPESDDYKVCWKEDETGDDLLTSLVTFQTIFEEKANTNEGLSDLLEQRAKELKYQKLREKEEKAKESERGTELPPRLPDCLSLSYRNGAKHRSLTLFHTMKMKSEKDRINAYDTAFHHCVHADSKMRQWLNRKREAPRQENSKLIQVAKRPTVKKGLLTTLSSRKNKSNGDNLRQHSKVTSFARDEYANNSFYPAAVVSHAGAKRSMSENEYTRTDIQRQTPRIRKPNIDAAESIPVTHHTSHKSSTNIASQYTADSSDHNEASSRLIQTSVPISISNNDRYEGRDNSSIISSESTSSKKTQANVLKAKSSRLFSSIGRKTSMKPPKSSTTQRTPSIRSFEKNDSGIKLFSIRKAAK